MIASNIILPQNLHMQQSLCHLYFLTVMDHLWSKNYNAPTIVKFGSEIQEQLRTAEKGKAAVLWVEVEAVIQVLIKQLTLHFDPTQPHKIGDIYLLIDDINKLELVIIT